MYFLASCDLRMSMLDNGRFHESCHRAKDILKLIFAVLSKVELYSSCHNSQNSFSEPINEAEE